MSDPQSTQVIDRNEQQPPEKPVEIAGYTLESRLGVGGYGEVWKAIGPGGLAKAIKILFGRMDGPQADAELKSLERMRDLRHPFLLSIERIEVVDGRLVVVTELADGCLENRFQQVRTEGLKGVPREELLGYLRDSADALDFMFEEHGLQHLDIKPENLLLQGKHVKVGDFGLAKDVSVTNMSLVGGFTPLYAPPEIFEGKPSRTSDQYSLAIVYQTMLTGVPPFSGRTAAQLTAQHLRSTPDLSSLQPVDRPVIARALSKNPNARFPNCRQFVDELTKRRNSRNRSKATRSGTPLGAGATKRVSVGSMAVADELQIQETTPLAPPKPLPQAMFRPTLYVGVGGLGGAVLHGIRRRFADNFGDAAATAFPMLYIDTNRRAVAARVGDAEQPGLGESERLAIPLRTANEYRSDHGLKLDWLSRRWLFNLPRSGEVEGIRPLGRLALMDHESAVRQRLVDTLEYALTDESVIATNEETQLQLQAGALDVVIVGSTSGGSGSGAILDVAAIVRDVIGNLDVGITSVIGVLVHATSSQREIGDIQEANTISCLKELRHYRTPGLEEANPFDHTYVVQLGDSLTSQEFVHRTEDVSDYIYDSTATSARRSIDQWRDMETSKSVGANGLRTFGASSVDEALHGTVNEAAGSLAYALVQKWSGPGAPIEAELTEARSFLQRLSLSEARLSARIMTILRGDPGKEIEAWSKARWVELATHFGPGVPSGENLIAGVEASFKDGADARVDRILTNVASTLPQTCDEAKEQVEDFVLSMLDHPGRLNGAIGTALEIVTQLELASNACERLLTEIERSFQDVKAAALQPELSFEDAQTRCHQYCVIRFYRTIYGYFVDYARAVLETAKKTSVDLSEMRATMRPFAASFIKPGTVPSSQPDFLVQAFDQHVLTSHGFRLADMLVPDSSNEQATEMLLRDAETYLLANASGRPHDTARSQGGFPESAKPELPNVGGGRRVLAVLPPSTPPDVWQRKLQAAFGDCVVVQSDPDQTKLAVTCEIEGISIETLLDNFRHKNPRLMDVAGRVHTRVDIDW